MPVRFGHLLLLLALSIGAGEATAQLTIFLDFGTDWQQRLAEAAADASVPVFDATERTQIEQRITDSFVTALDDFDVTVMTSDPGGSRERVDFGATTTINNLLGQTQLDFRNAGSGNQSVFTRNFSLFIESDEPRDQQLSELAVSLAGTALHEQGHSFGLRHHAAYGTASISPENYDNTGGAQNQHFMATGSTGINEDERELPRTWSDWSLLTLETAFGLTPTPLTTQIEAGDAAGEPLSAQPLDLTALPISGADAGLVYGRLATEADVDTYRFDVSRSSRLTVELWSDEWFGSIDDFDGSLRLLDDSGDELSFSDGLLYDGDTFGAGTDHGDDAFLLNVRLPAAGTYYFQVASAGPSGGTASGEYQVLFGAMAVPEPSGMGLLGLVWIGLLGRRTRLGGT